MDLEYLISIGIRPVELGFVLRLPGDRGDPSVLPRATCARAQAKQAPAALVADAVAPAPKAAPAPTAESTAPAAPSSKRAAPAPDAAPAAPAALTSSGGPGSGGRTEHVFLTDSYLFELSGCSLLEAAASAEPPKGAAEGHVKLSVVLSKTIFHPQGGGQASDHGTLSAQGLPELPVSFVSVRKQDNAVLHDCAVAPNVADAWIAAAGSALVRCLVDEARRRACARIHSAGHLLDAAVTAVDLKWVPGKGYHFEDGPYVEYVLTEASRKVDPKKAGDKEEVVKAIQDNVNRLIAQGGPVSVRYVDGVRHVAMAGEECGCGGTHVKDISEIGGLEVKKVQNKQGNVRLSYTVAKAA